MERVEFGQHRIWTLLEQVNEGLKSVDLEFKRDKRFRELLKRNEFLYWILRNSDPQLVSLQELDSMSSALEAIAQHLPNSANRLRNALYIIERYSEVFTKFPAPRRVVRTKADAEAVINDLRGKLAEFEAQVEKEMSDVFRAIDYSRNSINETNQRGEKLASSLGQIEATIGTRYESWEVNLKNRLESELIDIRSSVQRIQSDAEARLKQATSVLDAREKEQRSKHEKELLAARESSDEVFADIARRFASIEEDAKRTLDNITAIYQQAGQVALAGGFVEASETEGSLYKQNSLFAKLCFLLAAIVMAFMYYRLVQSQQVNDIYQILLRIPVSIIFFVPGVYFSSLASKHRRTSVSLKSLGLRIKSFDAFLTGVDEESKRKLQSEIVGAFFKRDFEEIKTREIFSRGITPETLEAMVKRLVDR